MNPTAQQIAENVVVLMLRTNMKQTDLAPILGISRNSVGQRISGRIEWRAAELQVMAQVFRVTPSELMGKIPDFKEWDRRSRPQPTLSVAPGPRFLVMPVSVGDGFTFTRPLSRDLTITADRLSLIGALSPRAGARRFHCQIRM